MGTRPVYIFILAYDEKSVNAPPEYVATNADPQWVYTEEPVDSRFIESGVSVAACEFTVVGEADVIRPIQ